MSSGGATKKQPKPFLKRGTRQFLSNATVRSLNQKPRIMEFQQESQNAEKTHLINKNQFKEDQIKIQVKSKIPLKKSQTFQFVKQQEPRSLKQNKIQKEQKITGSLHSSKKRSAVLDDYLGGKKEEIGSKKQIAANISRKQAKGSRFHENENKMHTMAGMLKRQDEDELDSDENESYNSNKKMPSPPVLSQQKKAYEPDKRERPQEVPKTISKMEQSEDLSGGVHIISDDDSDQEDIKVTNQRNHPKNNFSKKTAKQMIVQEEKKDQRQQENEEKPTYSNILTKYYKKAPPPDSNTLVNAKNEPKKLTINDISNELKQQIITECIAQKQQDLNKKLEELQAYINKTNKSKEKYEEELKNIARQKAEFQKEMEARVKKFEEEMKMEKEKIFRDKKVIHNKLTSNKSDKNIKNQYEELKEILRETEVKKKESEAKLKAQIDRLKKKLEEETQKNRNMEMHFKHLEANRVLEKQQIKELMKKESGLVQVQKNVNYWCNAPTSSYVSQFFEDDFSLIQMEPYCYNFENIEYYQYYLTLEDNSELVSQESYGEKIVRKYRNGKQEIQFVQKTIKEVFPFGLTIVRYCNEDIKLILPEGIQVYYNSRNEITEFIINPNKVIYNFHKINSIEMKYKEGFPQSITQRLEKGVLTRRKGHGETKYRKEKGKIMQV